MIKDRRISLIRFDANGNKQLTRVLFEVETQDHLISEKFIWLKIDDPTTDEMNQVINALLKPELQKNLKGHDVDLLVEDLKRDYFMQKNRILEKFGAVAG